jgi:hypothetical protein
MIGRTLSVVTLNEPATALSANYLQVQLARAEQPNRLVDVEIGGLTATGLSQKGLA